MIKLYLISLTTVFLTLVVCFSLHGRKWIEESHFQIDRLSW
jgi:hypothetical protein